MADIVRWDPFREMTTLRQAMDSLFEDSFVSPAAFSTAGLTDVAMDMYETDSDIVIKAELPGVKPEEVNISVANDVLTIKGEHKEEQEDKEANYWWKEMRYGNFSRSLRLPSLVNSDKAEAEFENGVLTLTIPKAEEVKPKQIKVRQSKMIEGGKK